MYRSVYKEKEPPVVRGLF